jgi:O-antigen ligase
LGFWYVLLAGRRRLVLATGLLGVILSACIIGLSMLPNYRTSGRLGLVILNDELVGNPVQLGTALAIGFLLLAVDQGRWLSLPARVPWRWVLLVPTAGLLALTTSRAAWFVVAAGLVLALVFGRRQRLRVLLVVVAIVGVLQLVLLTPFGSSLQTGLNRTFGSDRSLANRTSGRSDQWLVAYKAATASWDRLLWGYGPGRGAAVYAQFSERVEGVHYSVGRETVLHSLIMQVMVEAGLLGLAVFCIWLASVFWRVASWSWRKRLLLPMIACFGYLVTILTVSGNDTISGVMLGLGLLATSKP